MGKAGQALKQILEKYDISQNSLAIALDVERGSVYRWVHEVRDPQCGNRCRNCQSYQGTESCCRLLTRNIQPEHHRGSESTSNG